MSDPRQPMALPSESGRPAGTGDAGPSELRPDGEGEAPLGAAPFPIVGIGASAGGLGAFEAFFSGLPNHHPCGMAFILVQHLDPAHKSILAELVQRSTHLKVLEVEDGMRVEPDCVYIIPPNRDMALLNGALHLMAPSEPRGQRLPINFFFQSLAQDLGDHAIGIVLSGTGTDGTLGARAIKDADGMVMAQAPRSTEFEGMPGSAIATGLVDYVLAAEEMMDQLRVYAAHMFGHVPRAPFPAQVFKTEHPLKQVIVLLRAATGHDFSQYKANTLQRRVERRMVMHRIDSVEGYIEYLRQAPAEAKALFHDLLITVTHFFRDAEAFKALEEKVIPSLFARAAGSEIRVWSPGCSTGEEPYSLAILLRERMSALQLNFLVKVFATDIDTQAIATARAGCYPALIANDVGPERLARFFTLEADGSTYRIQKAIRDLVIFSEQNLIRDPPFSNLDLICCRNLLIYLNADLHKRLIPLFHYALKPGGFLFQGSSETIGEYANLFAVVDRKAKVYRSKEPKPSSGPVAQDLPFAAMGPRALASLPKGPTPPAPAEPTLGERVQEALLAHCAPVGALVDSRGDILYLHGQTGLYLEPPPGEPSPPNLFKMAKTGLRCELSNALAQSAAEHVIVRSEGLPVAINGGGARVTLTVRPMPGVPSGEPWFLVVLEEAPGRNPRGMEPPDAQDAGADTRFAALRQELWAKEEHLRATNHELAGFNQKLQSAYEELQSLNEELRSANEELMTTQEELQSVNEELATINAELQVKVADLSRANNDLNNLLAGTNIATVFVDPDLRILRFTPTASAVVNLVPSDAGRPLGHFATNILGYDRLVQDTLAVLDTLNSRTAEVQTADGRWYTMCIQPYRTLEHVIEGAVITFVDITEAQHYRQALQKTQERLRVVRDAQIAFCAHDLSGRILAWNPAAERAYGWSEEEALGLDVRERFPAATRDRTLADLRQLGQTGGARVHPGQRLARDGRLLNVAALTFALRNEAGAPYAIATLEWPRPCKTGGPA